MCVYEFTFTLFKALFQHKHGPWILININYLVALSNHRTPKALSRISVGIDYKKHLFGIFHR